jgi:hypothetical protein
MAAISQSGDTRVNERRTARGSSLFFEYDQRTPFVGWRDRIYDVPRIVDASKKGAVEDKSREAFKMAILMVYELFSSTAISTARVINWCRSHTACIHYNRTTFS